MEKYSYKGNLILGRHFWNTQDLTVSCNLALKMGPKSGGERRKTFFASTTASKVVGRQDLVEVQEVIATSDEEQSSDSQHEESAGI